MPNPQADNPNPANPGISKAQSFFRSFVARGSARSRLRIFALLGASFAIFTKLVLLSPRPLDRLVHPEDEGLLDPDSYFESTGKETSIPGIPHEAIPDYAIDGFTYTATESNHRLWRVMSDKAFLYDHLHLAHLKKAQAQIFNAQGGMTIVWANEAKYDTISKRIDFYGNVKLQSADDYVVRTNVAFYLPDEYRVEVPIGEKVVGDGTAYAERGDSSNILNFTSSGIRYFNNEERLILPSQARVFLLQRKKPAAERRETVVEADRAIVDRKAEVADFEMYASRKPQDRFVRSIETKTYARSRHARLNFGKESGAIHYLVMKEDVLVKERESAENPSPAGIRPNEPRDLRYATSGLAEFDVDRDQITLTVFPQFYQGADTVTGEKIVLHRESQLVEVEQGNAFSTGRRRNSR